MQENKLIIYLRVSSLSHIEFCPKRSKIECFTSLYKVSSDGENKGPIAIGKRLHYQYSYPFKDFDRVRVRALLGNKVFEKRIEFKDFIVVVRGFYDDLRVIVYNLKKYVSLIEVKTTRKKYMWSREIKAAIKQLQLYMWLLKDILEIIGYPLWERGYLEIFSQNTGYLLRRIPVEYDDNIEEWIKDAVDMFRGLKPMNVPPIRYCKLCYREVKDRCSWYQLIKENLNEKRKRI